MIRSYCACAFSAARRNSKTSCSTQFTFSALRSALCARGRQAFAARFHRDHRRRAGARASERERPLAREAIEHAPLGGVLRDRAVVRQLIEIEPGLLRIEQIDVELHADRPAHRRRALRIASEHRGPQLHPFRTSHRRIVSLDDR